MLNPEVGVDIICIQLYSISHRPGKNYPNADVLSRLPLPVAPANVPEPGDTNLLFEILQVDPLSPQLIKRWTDRDPVLSKVHDLCGIDGKHT